MSTAAPLPAPPAPLSPRVVAGFVALFASAAAMGASGIFVRLAETGPFASAFWRVALSLPFLWVWAFSARGSTARQPGWSKAEIGAGLLFAGDLFFWHLAIRDTSITNATLLATLAPVWIVLASGMVLGERVGRRTLAGLGLCLLGGLALVGGSWHMATGGVKGDLWGLITSFFFAAYFLTIKVARADGRSAGLVMARSTVVTTLALFVVVLVAGESFRPESLAGLGALVALALVSQVGGQGLLAVALGVLPAAFSSLVIFLESVAAASLGWLVLDEPLTLPQMVGGVAILAGVFIARPGPGAAEAT